MASNEINTELESFREQWRAEVRAKVPGTKTEAQRQQQSETDIGSLSVTKPTRRASKAAELPRSAGKKLVQHDEVEDEYHRSQSFDEPAPYSTVSHGHNAKGKGKEEAVEREPVSALEHYEKAVERELAGRLGDSLSLYRKAFRVHLSHFVPMNPRFNSLTCGRWTIASTKSTRTSISRHRLLPKRVAKPAPPAAPVHNPMHPMRRLQYQAQRLNHKKVSHRP